MLLNDKRRMDFKNIGAQSKDLKLHVINFALNGCINIIAFRDDPTKDDSI